MGLPKYVVIAVRSLLCFGCERAYLRQELKSFGILIHSRHGSSNTPPCTYKMGGVALRLQAGWLPL